jgi:hypothetical protein
LEAILTVRALGYMASPDLLPLENGDHARAKLAKR